MKYVYEYDAAGNVIKATASGIGIIGTKIKWSYKNGGGIRYEKESAVYVSILSFFDIFVFAGACF